MKRILVALATSALTATGLVGLSASPAAASSPACTTWIQTQIPSGRGLAELPGTSTGSTYCHLQRYLINRGVLNLQGTLNLCYAYYHNLNLGHGAGVPIAEDGNFGPETVTAMKRVQAFEHVDVDGIYGPNTRNAMEFPHVDASSGCVPYR
ncbi:peptidoglycan-binding protein [Streptomyces lunaelactis]|uniref:peptidoglycan-binding domain-containing protein n=1 Tax=Streptomyces lunaelactis TaxID=1535768 RepID=UPI0015849527|nr:peptidoglycan-binding domain-containing protein [Streptomyces lunaelactis]NUL02569.1 peptidoglycan-binding protein [Streptomyces lunaelactis]